MILASIWAVQMRTVPYLVDNPQVGFVQARWAFTNSEESFLTKVRAAGSWPKQANAYSAHFDFIRERMGSAQLCERVGVYR